MIKNVIFDVDGTLVDSNRQHAEAWQRAFASYGKQIEFDAILQQIGKGGDQLMPVFLSPEELEQFGKQLEAERGALFQREYLPHIKAFPAVRQLVSRIKQGNARVALASSAKSEEVAAFKRLTELTDLLEEETSADDADASKPAPDIFLAALHKLGNPAREECVVIGDTPYDAMAAGQAGLAIIGFTCGGWSAADLREAGCVEIYASPADLLARFDESVLGR